jgi:hypothetical protein
MNLGRFGIPITSTESTKRSSLSSGGTTGVNRRLFYNPADDLQRTDSPVPPETH